MAAVAAVSMEDKGVPADTILFRSLMNG